MTLTPESPASSAALIGNSPDRAAAIFGHEQRAVVRDRDADRPAPYLRVGEHEAGHEILVFAGGLAGGIEQEPDDLVARALREFEFILSNTSYPRKLIHQITMISPLERRVKIGKPSQDHEGHVIIERRGDAEAKAEKQDLDVQVNRLKAAVKAEAEGETKAEAKKPRNIPISTTAQAAQVVDGSAEKAAA